jgi:transketolase
MKNYPEAVILKLSNLANQLRLDALKMIYERGAGHPGGSLSCAEIISTLYFNYLKVDPKIPDWKDRDRFILSKGHASAIFYAALARRGFFEIKELQTWGHPNSRLQGHPDRLKTPGVDMTAGTLGQGLSIASGIGLAARLLHAKWHIYVLMGDGECQSGVVWEGAMMASKYHLSNITAIIDYNDVQLDGACHDIMPLEPFVKKWQTFNFTVIEINGHNIKEILRSLDLSNEIHDRPSVIIAHTTKGKGVSFMENEAVWHGIAPNDEQYRQAVAELKEGINE